MLDGQFAFANSTPPRKFTTGDGLTHLGWHDSWLARLLADISERQRFNNSARYKKRACEEGN